MGPGWWRCGFYHATIIYRGILQMWRASKHIPTRASTSSSDCTPDLSSIVLSNRAYTTIVRWTSLERHSWQVHTSSLEMVPFICSFEPWQYFQPPLKLCSAQGYAKPPPWWVQAPPMKALLLSKECDEAIWEQVALTRARLTSSLIDSYIHYAWHIYLNTWKSNLIQDAHAITTTSSTQAKGS
jgi:hypothetical protein